MSENHKCRVIIVEDEPFFLNEFIRIINSSPDFQVAAHASSVEMGKKIIQETPFDILLCDLGLPDGSGTELIKLCLATNPHIKPMVITIFGDEERVIESMTAGARGYILKDDPPENFMHCVRDLLKGYSPLSPKIARFLLDRIQNSYGDNIPSSPLTPRESSTLSLIAHGKSSKQVAKELGISDLTVNDYCKSIYRKLGVQSRTAAAIKGKERGWI
jgi:DNA-binding NarL/FixJ family response regulator